MNISSLDIKIFQINISHYEIRNLRIRDVVYYIVDEHRLKINNKKNVGKPLRELEKDNTLYISYKYDEDKTNSSWQSFLPNEFTNDIDFTIKQISYVLFAVTESNIYCLIGGNGLRVIRKFINEKFGIEAYEYLANPAGDIVVSMTSRGITGNLTEQRELYRKNQTLFDALDLTTIPTKITVEIREELKLGYFDFISFRNDKNYLEIGSYFHIKNKLDFEQFHFLIETIVGILSENDFNSLTSFIRIKDYDFIENQLQKELYKRLKEEIEEKYNPARGQRPVALDIDFLHPTKIIEFYECEEYQLKAKNKKDPFFTTSNKSELYDKCTKFIYESLDDLKDDFEFQKLVNGIRIIGLKKNTIKTQAMFINHINTEIKLDQGSYFKIDNYWYKIEENFLEKINQLCIETYQNHQIQSDFLNKTWYNTLKDENEYNNLYNDNPGYYVFDKIFSDNIELCDIMYESEKAIYLIHVKDDFDAKIRDVSNQILVSSNRLWHDLKNIKKSDFLENIVVNYNKVNKKYGRSINKNEFVKKFRSDKNIIYVMAFRTTRSNYEFVDRINKSNSNIAKYSLVQSRKDITKYQLQYYDLTENLRKELNTIV